MSDVDIAYDLRLAEIMDTIKKKMWIEEELQFHPKDKRDALIKSYLKLNGTDYL